MKLCVLGSGSSGNAIYCGEGEFSILIDAGLSRREIKKRLESIGVELSDISAILLTHEHGDHVRGLATISKNEGLPVYMNRPTASAVIGMGVPVKEMRVFRTGAGFDVGPFHILSFPVVHDALEPVGFVVEYAGSRVGILTDAGTLSGINRSMLRKCRALILEANHDLQLLENHPRPLSVKQRIRGPLGHLSNCMAAEFIRELASDVVEDIFLAHLSRDCNRPEIALSAISGALPQGNGAGVTVRLTYPDRVSDVVEYGFISRMSVE